MCVHACWGGWKTVVLVLKSYKFYLKSTVDFCTHSIFQQMESCQSYVFGQNKKNPDYIYFYKYFAKSKKILLIYLFTPVLG